MEDLIVQIIVLALVLLYPTWRICGKAGLNPAISLTILIPVLGFFICPLILALSEWEVQPKGGS